MRFTSLCLGLLILPMPFGKPRPIISKGPVVQLASGAMEGEMNGNVRSTGYLARQL